MSFCSHSQNIVNLCSIISRILEYVVFFFFSSKDVVEYEKETHHSDESNIEKIKKRKAIIYYVLSRKLS